MTSAPHAEGLDAGVREELLPLVGERLEIKGKLLSKYEFVHSNSIYAFTCQVKSAHSQTVLI